MAHSARLRSTSLLMIALACVGSAGSAYAQHKPAKRKPAAAAGARSGTKSKPKRQLDPVPPPVSAPVEPAAPVSEPAPSPPEPPPAASSARAEQAEPANSAETKEPAEAPPSGQHVAALDLSLGFRGLRRDLTYSEVAS